MAYSVAWNEAAPIGATVTAATLDTELQNLKKSVRERLNDILSGTTSWETDATDPKKLLSHAIGEPRAKVTASGTQSIPDSTGTSVAWNNESYDSDGMHDNSTNNERLTIVSGEDGIYLFGTLITFSSSVTGTRTITVRKNGSGIFTSQVAPPVATTSMVAVFPPLDLIATDYIDLQVSQTSGGSLPIHVVGTDSFWVFKVGD